MKFHYNKIFYFHFVNIILFTTIYVAININQISNSFANIPNVTLILIFIIISILIKNLPIYYFDKNFKLNEHPKNNVELVIYDLKNMIIFTFLILLLFQLVSKFFNLSGYYGDEYILFSVGIIVVSYPSNIEDILYIVHKLKRDSASGKVSHNLYYLLGYKLDEKYKYREMESMKTFRKPSFYLNIFALYSIHNCVDCNQKLNKFYHELLSYLLEKNYIAGIKAINYLDEKTDEIKFSNQTGKTYLFDWDNVPKKSKYPIYRKYIFANNILDQSWYSVAFVIISGALSIFYVTIWLMRSG